MRKAIFVVSITFNILVLTSWLLTLWLSPNGQLGRLEQTLKIGYFAADSVLFIVPKGITVEDASPWGLSAIGQFEPYRFAIIVTSDEAGLVNYSLPKDSLSSSGILLSADRYPSLRK
jgi:hypothetical protein